MATRTVSSKILNVTKTTAEWADVESVISKGLLCVEFLAGGKTAVKIGDGVSTYAELPYITDAAFSISDYYTSTQTDSAISNAISALGTTMRIKGTKATVAELPTSGNTAGDVWLVGTVVEGSTDSYVEYVWTEAGAWEYIGKVAEEVDLSDYVKTSALTSAVDTINGRLTTLEGSTHTHSNSDVLDATTASFTTALKNKLDAIDEEANKYTLPTASADTLGGVKVSEGSNLTINAEGQLAAVDTTYDVVEGATSTDAGEAGLVPAPAAGDQEKFLRGDGTWSAIPETYDDTELVERVETLETDAVTEADTLVLNCIL